MNATAAPPSPSLPPSHRHLLSLLPTHRLIHPLSVWGLGDSFTTLGSHHSHGRNNHTTATAGSGGATALILRHFLLHSHRFAFIDGRRAPGDKFLLRKLCAQIADVRVARSVARRVLALEGWRQEAEEEEQEDEDGDNGNERKGRHPTGDDEKDDDDEEHTVAPSSGRKRRRTTAADSVAAFELMDLDESAASSSAASSTLPLPMQSPSNVAAAVNSGALVEDIVSRQGDGANNDGSSAAASSTTAAAASSAAAASTSAPTPTSSAAPSSEPALVLEHQRSQLIELVRTVCALRAAHCRRHPEWEGVVDRSKDHAKGFVEESMAASTFVDHAPPTLYILISHPSRLHACMPTLLDSLLALRAHTRYPVCPLLVSDGLEWGMEDSLVPNLSASGGMGGGPGSFQWIRNHFWSVKLERPSAQRLARHVARKIWSTNRVISSISFLLGHQQVQGPGRQVDSDDVTRQQQQQIIKRWIQAMQKDATDTGAGSNENGPGFAMQDRDDDYDEHADDSEEHMSSLSSHHPPRTSHGLIFRLFASFVASLVDSCYEELLRGEDNFVALTQNFVRQSIPKWLAVTRQRFRMLFEWYNKHFMSNGTEHRQSSSAAPSHSSSTSSSSSCASFFTPSGGLDLASLSASIHFETRPHIRSLFERAFQHDAQPLAIQTLDMDQSAATAAVAQPSSSSASSSAAIRTIPPRLLGLAEPTPSCPQLLHPLSSQLSTLAKWLLFASFLASYNPASKDTTLFAVGVKMKSNRRGKSARVERRRKHVASAADSLAQMQMGPNAAPLERVMAIFSVISEDELSPTPSLSSCYVCLKTLIAAMLMEQVSEGGSSSGSGIGASSSRAATSASSSSSSGRSSDLLRGVKLRCLLSQRMMEEVVESIQPRQVEEKIGERITLSTYLYDPNNTY